MAGRAGEVPSRPRTVTSRRPSPVVSSVTAASTRRSTSAEASSRSPARRGLVGLVPAAVDDPGDGTLQGFAERNQQQRSDSGRERGGPPGVMIGRERDGVKR